MKQVKNQVKKQSGFTLVELILVLVIAALAIFIATTSYNSSRATQSANNMLVHSVLVSDLLRTRRSAFGTGDLTPDVVADGRATTGFWRTTGSGATLVATNGFGGVGTITGTGTGYTLQETLVDTRSCVQVMPQIASSNFKQVKIGAAAAQSTPITESDAVTACGSTPVTVQFIN
jgi:prepilin-type N-terminal cleavage/methylation domain-containing protein